MGRMEAVLREHGLRFEVRFTEHKGHAVELASRAVSEGYGTIVAVGGDGTVNEVVNAVVGSPATLAALPLGANNDFLRSLGIWSWREACQVLAAGEVRPLDVGLRSTRTRPGSGGSAIMPFWPTWASARRWCAIPLGGSGTLWEAAWATSSVSIGPPWADEVGRAS